MTCNKCQKTMTDSRKFKLYEGVFVSMPICADESCPNYALLQVPMEMMPKEKRSEFYGDGYIEVEKPSKVRREKKDVSKGEEIRVGDHVEVVNMSKTLEDSGDEQFQPFSGELLTIYWHPYGFYGEVRLKDGEHRLFDSSVHTVRLVEG